MMSLATTGFSISVLKLSKIYRINPTPEVLFVCASISINAPNPLFSKNGLHTISCAVTNSMLPISFKPSEVVGSAIS